MYHPYYYYYYYSTPWGSLCVGSSRAFPAADADVRRHTLGELCSAHLLVRPCAALGELKVARIHDIRFILCLGCCVCVGAGKGATSDELQLTVDTSTRERSVHV